jgi:membrane associated rhomboid family serine protease
MNLTKHLTATARQTTAQAVGHFRVMVMLVAALWFIEIADQIWQRSSPEFSLDALGIRPRTLWGVVGILFAPFVHGGFGHLANNTVPLIVLGWVVMLGGRRLFFKVSGLILVVAGVATWLFGASPGPHLGASGLVYGYLGFLLVRGFLEPSVRWVVVSVAVGVLYTGVLGALLPAGQVSGAGHLGGFIGGVLAGWLLFFLPKWRAGRLGGTPGTPGGNAPHA